MRIEAGDRETRPRQAEAGAEVAVDDARGSDDEFAGQRLRRLGKRNMNGHRHDRERLRPDHHDRKGGLRPRPWRVRRDIRCARDSRIRPGRARPWRSGWSRLRAPRLDGRLRPRARSIRLSLRRWPALGRPGASSTAFVERNDRQAVRERRSRPGRSVSMIGTVKSARLGGGGQDAGRGEDEERRAWTFGRARRRAPAPGRSPRDRPSSWPAAARRRSCSRLQGRLREPMTRRSEADVRP